TSAVPIKVDVVYFDIGVGTLGVCIPNAMKNFAGAPMMNTLYPTALANKIVGYDLDTAHTDMVMYISNTANFYSGTDGNCPANKIDLVSVALHEFGHGLGFADTYKMIGDTGSIGMITITDFPPLTFPFSDLGGTPFIYSKFVENNNGESTLDSTLFPNPSVQMGNEFTSNQMYFN